VNRFDKYLAFQLTKCNIGSKKILNMKSSIPTDYLNWLKRCTVLTKWGRNYPDLLRRINYPPAMLFCFGDVSLLSENVVWGIVGSRDIDQEGIMYIRALCEVVSSRGLSVVTGGAVGADKEVLSILRSKRIVISPVLGKRSRSDCELEISEFPFGKKITKGLFILRNRIIASLSSVLFVVQPKRSGGSRWIVEYARKIDKKVIILPNDNLNIFDNLI